MGIEVQAMSVIWRLYNRCDGLVEENRHLLTQLALQAEQIQKLKEALKLKTYPYNGV